MVWLASFLFVGAPGCAEGPTTSAEPAVEASLFGPEPVCPTAPERATLSWFVWRTTRQLDGIVWSSDGKQIGAAELVFEEMNSWNPLDGSTNKRRFCHQLSVLRPDGSLDHRVGPLFPNQHGDFSYMQPASYFIEQTLPPNLFEYYRVALDGSRKLLARITDGCTTGFVIPSPGGERLAFVQVKAVCSGPGSGSTATVSFFDAAGAPVGGTATHAFTGYAAGTWTPAGTFVVSDGSEAVSVELSGATAAAPVPHCTDPATTSSGVAADGRVLGFIDGKPGVVGVDPARAFGCQ